MSQEFDNHDFASRVDMYFFSPICTREEYIEAYVEKYNDENLRKYGGVRFSPLYLLRQDIFYSLGLNPTDPEDRSFPRKFGPPIFASIILMHIALGTVSDAVLEGKKYNVFAEKYLDLKSAEEAEAINRLRNALEHGGYSLCHANKSEENDKRKMYFQLKIDKSVNFIEVDKKWSESHESDLCRINPRGFHLRTEKTFKKVALDLADEKNMAVKRRFLEQSRIKDWILLNSKAL